MNGKMKKLLILGGFAQITDVIQDAVDAGYHVIVTDNIPDSPGKKIAHESHMISITDVEGLIRLCRERQVDGVMNYCIHSGQKSYQKVCEALDIPCYGTSEQFEILTEKSKFKSVCVANNLDVVDSYPPVFEDLMLLPESDFPIVIKPADGRASKGVSVCNAHSELEEAIRNASRNSANGCFIAEKFMNAPEVAVKYFVVDGEISLTSMSDIYTLYQEGLRVYIWTQTFPSRHYDLFLREGDAKVREFIRRLGVRNGPLSFSGFVDGERFRFVDPSFRMGGAQDWLIVEEITGVNISKLMTQFAVTGSMGDPSTIASIDGRFSQKAASMLYFLVGLGTVGKVVGVDEARNVQAVIGCHQTHREGDVVKHFGTSEHVLLRFLLVAENVQELIEAILEVQSCIAVFDDRGRNMLLQKFDPALLVP